MEPLNSVFGAVFVLLWLGDVVSAQGFWLQQQQQQRQTHQSYVPPQLLQQQNKVPEPTPVDDKCQVEEKDMIQCGPSDTGAEQCQNINCCFNGRQCYYGKAVTVQCTRDGQFVVVVARDATRPPIDVDSISLQESDDPSCGPVDFTSSFVIFQFPMTACGTVLKEEAGYVVYENHMSSAYEVGVGSRGSITRDSHFELLFQCRYSDTAVQALVMEVNEVPPPLPAAGSGPLRVELRLGKGRCYSKGCREDEVAFTSFYTAADYPVTKALREPVYTEVRIVERSDPNIILNLEHCWATAGPNPYSLPQWDLLVDGCPNREDRYQTTVLPVDGSSGLLYPSHYKRFIVQMFTFVEQDSYTPQRDTVFIHCSTSVCHPSSTESCEQPCHRQRRAAVRTVSPDQRAMVSSGEVILTEDARPVPDARSRR